MLSKSVGWIIGTDELLACLVSNINFLALFLRRLLLIRQTKQGDKDSSEWELRAGSYTTCRSMKERIITADSRRSTEPREEVDIPGYYSMSVHSVQLAGQDENRDYLLGINPNWMDASTTDVDNQIDARWFDTMTGLYIDITALRWDEEARSRGIDERVMCKDDHRYLHHDIFPLRSSAFEDAPVKIPFAYANTRWRIRKGVFGLSFLEE